ncbi:hypothetical protein M2102_001281 [Fusobacterium sp. PH5-7]|uniref:hypothetical protein n=1 Tax=Fusobacterium sp. PH5-7 TaxID=2940528 RepID=UPI0024745193|nr:hypothetical protein [Fusobacterium sp. PH5-7]MDH6457653.1 hypothetical protein [Fusobacterium sp. PH5-7]
MNKETIFLIGILGLVTVGIILLYKYKREALKAAAYYIVVQAEENFISGQGKEKLRYAIKELKKKVPWYFAWIISESFIIKLIEDVLSGLQSTFKGDKEKQLNVINKVLEAATTGQDMIKITKQMEQDVSSKGYIEGYLEGKTDFKGDSNIVGGLRAGVKL